MLRIIETFRNLPTSVEVDSDANFQPGQIGSLRIKGGKSVVGVCDGLHPCGVLDDIRSNTFRAIPTPPVEVHVVPISNREFDERRKEWVLGEDVKVELKHANIIKASFVSSVDTILQPIIGVLFIPKGTSCNYCLFPKPNGRGDVNDAVRFSCKYAYNVPADSFEDSTANTNRVTVWTKNMIADTDMYDTSKEYAKYSLLYVENGLLTTKRSDYNCKCIGVVLEPPSAENSMLRFLLDLEGRVEIGVPPPYVPPANTFVSHQISIIDPNMIYGVTQGCVGSSLINNR